MLSKTIGIIGIGPRGLSVLERIIASSIDTPEQPITIKTFDPNLPGSGCHDVKQPDHLLVNTVSSQITMFADHTVKHIKNVISGPTFYQWLSDRKHLNNYPSQVFPNEYYSRASFGKYLNWVFRYLIDMAPPHVTVEYQPLQVVDLEKVNSATWHLIDEHNGVTEVDYLYVTTGHTNARNETQDTPQEITNPYPMKAKLHSITEQHTVAIQGLGLTTCDILAELTIGRGGTFVRSSRGMLEYIPSGNEPYIFAYSRTGLPLSGRGANEKGASEQYQAKFLTASKVAAMRARGSIDFRKDVLPLLIKDMEYAYYESYLTQTQGVIAAQTFCNKILYTPESQKAFLIAKTIAPEDRFSWEKMVSPLPNKALQSPQSYVAWLLVYLENDLIEAQKGNMSSPIKSASDVMRDLRDIIRDVIDFKGLTEESHRWLDTVFIPVMNRIAVGPPKERTEEMLALVKSGVLNLSLGPSPEVTICPDRKSVILQSTVWPELQKQADIKIHGKISMHSPKDDATEFWQNLLTKQFARLYFNGEYHPGGIDVTPEMNVINATGDVHQNMWALGMPTEGSKFYTFIVPRPGVNSTAIVDAGKAVNALFKHMDISYLEEV